MRKPLLLRSRFPGTIATLKIPRAWAVLGLSLIATGLAWLVVRSLVRSGGLVYDPASLVFVGGLLASLLLFRLTRARQQESSPPKTDTLTHESQFAGVIHMVSDAVIGIDHDQKIILFNPAAERIFRCTASEAIGSPLSRFMPKRFRGAHRVHAKTLRTAGLTPYQMDRQRNQSGLRKNGEKFPIEASIFRYEHEGRHHYTVVLRDLDECQPARTMQRLHHLQFERAQAVSRFGSYHFKVPLGRPPEAIYWSSELYRILGRDPLLGPLPPIEYVAHYVHPDDQARILPAMEQALARGGHVQLEYRVLRIDKGVRHIRERIECFSTDADGALFFGLVHDNTEIEKANSDSINLSKRFRVLGEQLPSISYIATATAAPVLLHVSPKIEQLLGFTAEEWRSDPNLFMRQVHPDDRVAVSGAIQKTLVADQEFSIDYRIFAKNGDARWLHDQGCIIYDGDNGEKFLQGIILDITERKRVQSELERSQRELQKIITALDLLREEEQKRLAKELHDDLGQLMAAMKMDLCTLERQLTDDSGNSVQQVGTLHELVDQMVVSVRRIIADLPPKALDDFGFFDAIECLLANFEKRHQIACRLHIPSPRPLIDNAIATPLYRMVQEALNNVAKHSAATSIDVAFSMVNGRLVLRVKDNGKGILSEELRKPGSFGLIGMRERVSALGGSMQLLSPEAAGTVVQITIPLNGGNIPIGQDPGA